MTTLGVEKYKEIESKLVGGGGVWYTRGSFIHSSLLSSSSFVLEFGYKHFLISAM